MGMIESVYDDAPSVRMSSIQKPDYIKKEDQFSVNVGDASAGRPLRSGGSDSTSDVSSEAGREGRRGSSASTVSVAQCRICQCEEVEPGGGGAPLIAPCACAGSLRYVHQRCLQQWIKSADTRSCELCKYDFLMSSKLKPLRKWQRLEMGAVERRKITCSVTFHVIAVTCVIWSLYVLIERTAEEVRAGALEWPFWTKLVVVAIGFTGGLVFMYVQCRMYAGLCRRWRAYNRVVLVRDCPESVRTAPCTGAAPPGASQTPCKSESDSAGVGLPTDAGADGRSHVISTSDAELL